MGRFGGSETGVGIRYDALSVTAPMSLPHALASSPPPRPGRARAALALALALAACGGAGGGGGGEEGGGASTGGDTEAQPDNDAEVPSEDCAGAPAVAQGSFAGSLRGRTPDPVIGGVCGGGGPDVFLRVEVPLRADLRVEARGNGFTPRVSLAPVGCLSGPMLTCGANGVVELADLEAGTMVNLAIGVDEETFAQLGELPLPDDGTDPLGFVVDVGMTRVLARGEACRPAARGRCAAGSLCLQQVLVADTEDPEDIDDADAVWSCTPLEGDHCIDPERVAVQLVDGDGTLIIDPDVPQSDAHHHSCTGEGTRERLLRLRLPGGLGVHSSLQIRTERPEIGLALRAPGCLASEETACAPPSPAGSQVTIAAPDELQRAGVEPYLFVEMPEPGVLTEPVILHLRRVLHAPPVGSP